MGNVVQDFAKEFHEEVLELLILPKASVGGAAVVGAYLRPSVTFMALVQNGELLEKTGRLEWLVKQEEGRSNFGYGFQPFVPYLVKVRPCIEKALPPYALAEMNHRFMLLEVLGEGVNDPILSALGKKMAEPVIQRDDALGEFLLNRQFDWFEGEMQWLGEPCSIMLEVDEACAEACEDTFATLKRLYQGLALWDQNLRVFAAKELTALANEWQQEDGEIGGEELTEEAFAKRMIISEISIFQGGEMEVYFADDDMFWGHVILVSANISGEITQAHIGG